MKKKAKQLRKETGFHPSQRRRYETIKHGNGKTTKIAIGKRRDYQDLKKRRK